LSDVTRMDFSKMPREELEEYVSFMLRQYRLVDALWFLGVEDRFGLDEAVKLNEDIWEDVAFRSAKEIKNKFKVTGSGIHAVIKALRYFPWTLITGYEIEELEDTAMIRVPRCPPQEARVKSGRKIFPCKAMHQKDFQSFANAIDERVEVNCIFAPLGPRPADLWCEWKFTLKQNRGTRSLSNEE